ncbi:hypothetical protein EJB05_35189, partial [Eragrostis curvula]
MPLVLIRKTRRGIVSLVVPPVPHLLISIGWQSPLQPVSSTGQPYHTVEGTVLTIISVRVLLKALTSSVLMLLVRRSRLLKWWHQTLRLASIVAAPVTFRRIADSRGSHRAATATTIAGRTLRHLLTIPGVTVLTILRPRTFRTENKCLRSIAEDKVQRKRKLNGKFENKRYTRATLLSSRSISDNPMPDRITTLASQRQSQRRLIGLP